jgi:hypothetical protein
MKTRFVIAMPALVASLAFAATMMPAECRAQTTTAPTQSASATIANAVRIFPRAGFAAQMVGGEIQGSNQSATAGFMTLAKIDKAPREGEWTRIALNNSKPYRFCATLAGRFLLYSRRNRVLERRYKKSRHALWHLRLARQFGQRLQQGFRWRHKTFFDAGRANRAVFRH